MNRHLERALPWLVMAVAGLLLYGRYLTGWVPVGADNSLMYAPFYSLHWSLSHGLGGAPLWNPYSLSGTALIDNLQAALLYPLRWPFFFIADWRDWFGPFNFLHYIVALAGAWVLLRVMGLGRGAALAGALLYGVGGHVAGRIINPTIFYGCCWLPWLLAGAAGRERRHAWLATLGAAAILWVGSPHLMFYGAIGFALVFVLCGLGPTGTAEVENGPGVAPRVSRSSNLGLIASRAWHLALAFILAALALLPGIQRAGESIRTVASARENLADSVAWGELPKMLLGGTGAAIHPEYIDKSIYVGAVALVIILGFALRRAAWRDRRFLAGLALVGAGVFFALGKTVGLDRVMPWIPGYNRLAGAPRALILAVAGLALLTALSLDAWPRRAMKRTGYAWLGLGLLALAGFAALAWGVPTPQGHSPFTGDWLRAWAFAPGVTGFFTARDAAGQVTWNIPLFPWVDSALGLLAGGLILILTGPRHRLRLGLIVALLFAQLWHFYPRVAGPVERAAYFDPPRPVAWLQRFQAEHPREPFRVAGYDPLRLHDAEFYNRHKIALLTPNLATLYGLEDIQGFDPLISLDYVSLFLPTTGRAPFNDPIHNLDIEHPDPRLFDLLGVRFLVGHPYDRRLTTIPLSVYPGAPTARVPEWEERPTAGPITHWGFVSLLDGAIGLAPGTPVAMLHIEAAEGVFDFPIRNGIETADLNAFNVPPLLRDPAFAPTVNMEWWTHTAVPRLDYRLKQCNYRSLIDFGRPLTVRHAWWRVTVPNVMFQVASQSYRLARPVATTQAGAVANEDPWRLVNGSEEEIAPVFEYLPAKPRAVLLAPGAGESLTHKNQGKQDNQEKRDGLTVVNEINALLDTALTSGTAAQAGKPNTIEWLERGNDGFALRVETPGPARLALREMWAPGWRAEVNNRVRPVIALAGLLRAVDVPAGKSEVRFIYRPEKPLWLLVVALVVLTGQLIWEGWRWRRKKM